MDPNPLSGTTRDIDNRRAPSTELLETERNRLLESARRRHVLDALDGCEGPIGLSDLAAAVIERERGDQHDVDHVAMTLPTITCRNWPTQASSRTTSPPIASRPEAGPVGG